MELLSFTDRLLAIVEKGWERLPELLLTLLAGYILIKIAMAVLGNVIKLARAKQALKQILLSVINVVLWLLLVAALLQQVGLTQIALALSSTVVIVGLAVSVGSSSFVQDVVAGMFLSQDPDFNIGDTLKVNDIEGVVEKMDARKIRLRDQTGRLHVLPNSFFDKASWSVTKRH
jgi:moderate conductance mechanosensitive channel